MHDLPLSLYSANSVRQLDRFAIDEFGIPGITLMERAGIFAFGQIDRNWPDARSIAVFCGVGNNGGDGYVVARLAKIAGYNVRVYQLGEENNIKGDARIAYKNMLEIGVKTTPFSPTELVNEDVIVDGLLGTGLRGKVSETWEKAIECINNSKSPVLALDIPSGLHADTGNILGMAVNADLTTTFVGLKQGLFTADGPDCCGQILFDGLGISKRTYEKVSNICNRIPGNIIQTSLGERKKNSNKSHYGHVLVIGGDEGMTGAIRLAGEAAARTGAGLVSIAGNKNYIHYLGTHYPELMCHGVENINDLEVLIKKATVLVIGPGLGQSKWSNDMFAAVSTCDKPIIVDADALNLLAANPCSRNNWILTPHPGEAARLLGCSTEEIQRDRFAAITSLQDMYHGVVVLKGNGTLISRSTKSIALCDRGNPGMATGGMGDVLSGIIAGCVAQGLDAWQAALVGVIIHATAGDKAALAGQRGLLASDLINNIREVINYA